MYSASRNNSRFTGTGNLHSTPDRKYHINDNRESVKVAQGKVVILPNVKCKKSIGVVLNLYISITGTSSQFIRNKINDQLTRQQLSP